MPLTDTLRSHLTEAMKAGDTRRRDTLRLMIASINNARIAAQHELSDDEIVRVLRREVKQRQDSIEEFRKGNRPDLVAIEQAEMDIIQSYLPAPLSDEELRQAASAVIAEVGAQGAADIGKVMGPLLQRLGGRGDGRRANEVVRELLASS